MRKVMIGRTFYNEEQPNPIADDATNEVEDAPIAETEIEDPATEEPSSDDDNA